MYVLCFLDYFTVNRAEEVKRRPKRRKHRGDESQRRAVYIDTNEAFNKHSGIYVDSIDENQTDPSVTMETDDNETTPLLNKEFQKQEKHLKQKIYEQVARVDGTTRDLIQHGDNMSNSAAEKFKKVKRKKESKWKRCLCCCCHDNTASDG